ncbi:MAG: ABC transporter permease [Lautropia sp.]
MSSNGSGQIEVPPHAFARRPPARPEYECELRDEGEVGDVARPLSWWENLLGRTMTRRLIVLIVLAIAWQVYATHLDNPLMFPPLSEVLAAWWEALRSGVLVGRVAVTIQVLLVGYALGIVLAAVLTTVSVATRFGTDLLSTLTSMFNPLPAIALLPLALLWFGLGAESLVFVIVHSVLWAVALNAHGGFLEVSETQRAVGQNYGLRGIRFVMKILIPAALPSILSGLKIGWAFAWRTLIAAELVFGVSSSSGGLGWFIFEARQQLDTANVFAGLLTVILIGLLVESVIFRTIELRTVQRWGMQR